jgi:hypothetical protein
MRKGDAQRDKLPADLGVLSINTPRVSSCFTE